MKNIHFSVSIEMKANNNRYLKPQIPQSELKLIFIQMDFKYRKKKKRRQQQKTASTDDRSFWIKHARAVC